MGAKICYPRRRETSLGVRTWRLAQHLTSKTAWAWPRSKSAPGSSCVSAPGPPSTTRMSSSIWVLRARSCPLLLDTVQAQRQAGPRRGPPRRRCLARQGCMSSRPVTIRDYRESDEAGVIALARELQVQERTTFDRMKPEEDIGPAYVAALLGDVREHDGRFPRGRTCGRVARLLHPAHPARLFRRARRNLLHLFTCERPDCAGRSKKVATIEEIDAASAQGWAAEE